MKLEAPLSEIKGLGEKFLPRLKKLGLQTAGDLAFHFPFRYDDFSKISEIAALKRGEEATVSGIIRQVKSRRSWRRKICVTEALITDESGGVRAVWFNQPYIGKVLKTGKRVNLAGKVSADKKGGIYFSGPGYELITGRGHEPRHTAGLIPIYPETKGLTSKGLRYLIKPLLEKLDSLPEFLPEETLKASDLPEINRALRQIHFPSSHEEAALAKKRFAFADLFLMQIMNLRERLKLAAHKAPIVPLDLDYLKSTAAKLPFELTPGQKRSLWEILGDMEKERPMSRLLEGDVGSGKTVVAALAALMAARSGLETAFMAPTEILAHQHFLTFVKNFPDFERGAALLTAGESRVYWGDKLESKTSKTELKKSIAAGRIKIAFGTHSLIQKDVSFPNLALVVVDEQHRFGVKQRAELLRRSTPIEEPTAADDNFLTLPHLLSMSATPIPRTLALTIFGDLDLSVIDELPGGRKKIITKIVAPENRGQAYQFVREQIKKGRQAFVICPRIDSSQINADAVSRQSALLWETKAVKEEYEKLAKKIFPDLKVAMLHGKMKPKEKEEVMKRFASGASDILVSTSVVEVGVDVPNASLMMVESAERFGLASLYQFRGRVGRGRHQSFCLLLSESSSPAGAHRLRALLTAKNGFELAEKDLEIRGPGEILGGKQSGLPDLAMHSLSNMELVKLAREEAEKILKADPELKNRPRLNDRLERFKEKIHLE